MRAEAAAFAPGHITGFFEILDDAADPAQVGSRGAGFSVAHGVTSRVRVDDASVPGVTVLEEGRPVDAHTTRRAVDLLAGDAGIHVSVDQTVQLPLSQGFGMSAAGALSAALALAVILGRDRREAVWAAHCAEVLQRTGLGDVVGASVGGFELRAKPGCEPYGEVLPWRPEAPVASVALAVVGDGVPTRRVLSDARRRAEIQRVGRALVDPFTAAPSLSAFVDASRRFALEAHLATPEVLEALDALGPGAAAAQAQLGASVFVFSPGAEARRRLAAFGPVFDTSMDAAGARVTEPRRPLA